jgi:hypothetical protein
MKIIKLTESDLTKIVKRVIEENDEESRISKRKSGKEMKDLLLNIFMVFEELSTNMYHVRDDFFDLPTYWHADGVPFLIRATKKGVVIENHGGLIKKIIIPMGSSESEILNLIQNIKNN